MAADFEGLRFGRLRRLRLKLSGIRWRIVLVYLLLVFVATTIVGVFIMSRLESYYNDSVRSGMSRTAKDSGLLTSLESYSSLLANRSEIQNNIDAWARNVQYDLFVVDENWNVIAATIDYGGQDAYGFLADDVLFMALAGEDVEQDSSYALDEAQIPSKIMAFPIVNEDMGITGALYMRADMSSIFETIAEAQHMFLWAMALALAITVVLGFFIARSITIPITDVTEKVERMSRGDFSQKVSAKSNDEIGRLAEMFNLLQSRLDENISAISNEKNKLETILKYMADGLIVVDLSGRILHANPAAREILGISGAANSGELDADGRSFDEVVGVFSERLTLDKLTDGSVEGGGLEIISSDGRIFAVRYDRFKDDANQDAGVIMLWQDITEREKLEDMRTDFVANVSHELKTPLTIIKGYTETLIDQGLDDVEQSREFLRIVDAEADRMTRLVRDLLQLSRIDHNQEKWSKQPGNIIPLLRAAVRKVETMAAAKHQFLNCIFDPDTPLSVEMDRDRIEQVVLNLLSNAIKYTQEGGRIDVDAWRDGKFARIVVSDNGIGIPEEALSRVFERFFRVDKARSRNAGGTGLGLSISKQIVEEHKGIIKLDSREGRGTRVTIILPLIAIRGELEIE